MKQGTSEEHFLQKNALRIATYLSTATPRAKRARVATLRSSCFELMVSYFSASVLAATVRFYLLWMGTRINRSCPSLCPIWRNVRSPQIFQVCQECHKTGRFSQVTLCKETKHNLLAFGVPEDVLINPCAKKKEENSNVYLLRFLYSKQEHAQKTRTRQFGWFSGMLCALTICSVNQNHCASLQSGARKKPLIDSSRRISSTNQRAAREGAGNWGGDLANREQRGAEPSRALW